MSTVIGFLIKYGTATVDLKEVFCVHLILTCFMPILVSMEMKNYFCQVKNAISQSFVVFWKYVRLVKQMSMVFTPITFSLMLFAGCRSLPDNAPSKIMSRPRLDSHQLAAFFVAQNPSANFDRILTLANIYIRECEAEGINSDIAFAQMCLETGFLAFGGLVTADMNNFCGLGAVSKNDRGLAFETEEIGIRAHIQHLKGYAADAPLVNECVDPRYKYISPKGKAPEISLLSKTWATDPLYAEKLISILERMYAFAFKN